MGFLMHFFLRSERAETELRALSVVPTAAAELTENLWILTWLPNFYNFWCLGADFALKWKSAPHLFFKLCSQHGWMEGWHFWFPFFTCGRCTKITFNSTMYSIFHQCHTWEQLFHNLFICCSWKYPGKYSAISRTIFVHTKMIKMIQQLCRACMWLPQKYTKHRKQDKEHAHKANF